MRAQSMLEYIILVIIVVSGLASMQLYVQDRLNPTTGNNQPVKISTEVEQASPGITTVNGLLVVR